MIVCTITVTVFILGPATTMFTLPAWSLDSLTTGEAMEVVSWMTTFAVMLPLTHSVCKYYDI